jgi:3-hydroxyacyl-[acyl-carrier-protein] dehydratase
MSSTNLDIIDIMKMIPHRYPFLLIDKIISINQGIGAIALKNVTINENFFVGHFPGKPIMPGVLIIEAMAQAAAVFLIDENKYDMSNQLIYFTSIDNAKFRHPVVPGDALHLHVEIVHARSTVWKMEGRAIVGDKVVAESTFSAMLVENKNGK